MKRLLIGSTLYAILLIPFIRIFLEANMTLHMLVQMPLLIIAGWYIGKYLIERFSKFFENWNGNGVPGILMFIFITTYWMIPRAMDEALIFPFHEVFKYISLPIVGILLADSWKKIQEFGQAFVFLNYLPMFGVMGWLYVDAPIQMCNSYLIAEQEMLGWFFVGIMGVMLIFTLVFVFSDHSEEM